MARVFFGTPARGVDGLRLARGAGMAVFVLGDRDGTVVALDDETGATVWSQNGHDRPTPGIGSDDSTLFVVTIDGRITTLRP